MNKTSEKLIYILSTISFFIFGVYFLLSDYPYLIIIPFGIYLFVTMYIKRNKKIKNYVKEDFRKLGYELITERPLNYSETDRGIKPSILSSSSTPLNKYRNKYNRIFREKSKKGKLIELNTVVTEYKNGTLKIEIKEKKKL